MEGNQMKMREAVEAALAELDKFGQCHDARLHFSDIVHIGRARGILQAALSAPARNCDRFNNPEDAYEAWKEECKRVKNVNGGCRNCPYDTYKADSEKPSCVDMFLFAPAAERKGEAE